MKIHPAADLFPMMSEEDLHSLAEDIASNGLVHPIIIDEQKQIIDGRNRLAACKIAKVEPRFEQLNGRDALAYIVSANLARRNLTKGQQAMALAMIYPEPEKGGRGKNVEARKAAVSAGFSSRRLAEARSILRHSRDLAESVLKASLPFDDALARVEQARVEATSTEAKLARLRKAAPDLAARVEEETISVNEGLVILSEREADLRKVRETGRSVAGQITGFAGQVGDILSAIEAGEDIRIPPEHLKTLETALKMLIEAMERPDEDKSKR